MARYTSIVMEPRDLYGLPLDQFTAQRNSLAKSLRRDGRSDEAARVAKLRKPSVAAWGVNQLVRTQPRDLDALLKAGDALRKAQDQLLAKRGDSAALRSAVEAERAVVQRLSETARGLLSSDGHELTPARLEQVTETLHAVALNDDARVAARAGCLERELRHVGLGGLAAAGPPATTTESRRPRESAADKDAKQRDQLKAARQAETAARRAVQGAARELEAAQQRRGRAAEALRDAEIAVSAARSRGREAAQQLRDAQRAVKRLAAS